MNKFAHIKVRNEINLCLVRMKIEKNCKKKKIVYVLLALENLKNEEKYTNKHIKYNYIIIIIFY